MTADEAFPRRPGRGVSLVATPARWAACSGALAVGFVVATAAVLAFVHSSRPISSLTGLFVWVAVVGSALTVVLLRSEESRVARELRTARTGTSAMRGMAARRRQQLPFFARPFSVDVAAAAVRLADGDREGAAEALRRGPVLMRGGRLDRLRAMVEADVERATHEPQVVDRAIARLRSMSPLGNLEADRYRMHVLVKAVLERGDADMALELALTLRDSTDGEQAIYATWLRVWFELDGEGDAPEEHGQEPGGETGDAMAQETERAPAQSAADGWPPLAEADARLAALVARAHGAERLVDKLEARLLAIAPPGHQG
jgi:hypothetical protein